MCLKIETIATGVIPEILDACEIVSGLVLFSFSIASLERPPIKLSGLAGPEVIAAGREVFASNKCFNCHKVFWEGNSDRGPNLGTKQIGLYSEDYIKEQILDPRKDQAPGYEDKKSKKAMPTYYDEDLSEDELSALVAYLKTLRNP